MSSQISCRRGPRRFLPLRSPSPPRALATRARRSLPPSASPRERSPSSPREASSGCPRRKATSSSSTRARPSATTRRRRCTGTTRSAASYSTGSRNRTKRPTSPPSPATLSTPTRAPASSLRPRAAPLRPRHSAVPLPRPSLLRQPRGRTSSRLHLAPPDADARGAVRGGAECGGGLSSLLITAS